MNINVSFRHMDASPALREYATSKLEKICDKYVSGKVSADITFTVEKHRHVANFTLQISNLTVRGVEKTDDMYSSVDLALDKIEKQLRRHKDRIRDHKPSETNSKKFHLGVITPEDSVAEFDEDEDFSADYEKFPGPEGDESEQPSEDQEKRFGGMKLLKQGEFHAKPLTVHEAYLQLDLLDDRDFYVFTDAETKAVCVIYKRKDGHLGLISTGHE